MQIRDDQCWPIPAAPSQRSLDASAPARRQGPPKPGDALEAPDGYALRDLRRSLDLDHLRDVAPDLASGRLRRIAAVREQLREGTYLEEPRLPLAIDRLLRELDGE